MSQIELVTVVVADYDPAISFFVDVLGFELIEDLPSHADDGSRKRWVVVRPPLSHTGILLAKAMGADQEAAIRNQTAGRIGFFLRVDDFDTAYQHMLSLAEDLPDTHVRHINRTESPDLPPQHGAPISGGRTR